jgi:hypothetical protein
MANQNSLNNRCLNDFFARSKLSVNSSSTSNLNVVSNVAATPCLFEVRNTSNTTNADVFFSLFSAISGGNPFIQWTNGSGNFYSMGILQSSSNSLSICNASSLTSPASALLISSTAGVTGNLPVAFIAKKATVQPNCTGNGLTVTVVYDSVIVNSGAYNGTDTFTAPTTGMYRFCAYVRAVQVVGTTAVFTISTTTQDYQICNLNPTNTMQGDSTMTIGGTALCYMNAGDTCVAKIQISGSTQTVDLPNSASESIFSGILIH